MKFSNGCWLQREGCHSFSPKQIYYVKSEPTRLTLLLPTNRIDSRGATLGGINLTLEITSPYPGVLRARTFHHLGITEKEPHFELHAKENITLEISESEECISVQSGNLTLELNRINFSMTYSWKGHPLTVSEHGDLGLMKTNWKGEAYDHGDSVDTYIRQQLSIGVGEHLYGTGERFTPFIKNGQTFEIRNEDGGTGTSQTYKSIPFYISDRSYGVLVNHPETVSFEMASDCVSKVQFSVEGSILDYFVFGGDSMKEVLCSYTALSGRPALPPAWTFGLWLSTSFTTDYDEATVMSFIDGMLNRGIPMKVFHFDCFWMKEFHWSNFLWDERVFPDPEGMLQRIKAKGLKVCVWINPYIAQESCLFKEGMENGYLVKKANGDVWQWDMWQPGMALVDFTNPAACEWFQSKLKLLMDMGVDCFKTDFGERIPENVVYFDGSDPKKMHNYYTFLYNQTVFSLLESVRGTHDAVLFARSATVGSQQFPVHWGGDCKSNYSSMAESLRGGLSLMMSGFGFWSHDIGGFEQTSTPDVYKRWCAFGLLSSHSRLHGSSSYRVPWAYDEEAVDVLRAFTRLKARLMPYLYSMAIFTHESGIPMMRSMVLEFTQDPSCHFLDKQYMLGDSLLVAPVFDENGIAQFYVPDGVWTDFLTGEILVGGKYYTKSYDYLRLPLLVKEGSVIPIGCCEERPDYDYLDHPEFRVYELHDGTDSSTCITNENNQQMRVNILRNKRRIHIQIDAPSERSCTFRFIHLAAASAENASLITKGQDLVLVPDFIGSGKITVNL